jgi:hypothetical protein
VEEALSQRDRTEAEACWRKRTERTRARPSAERRFLLIILKLFLISILAAYPYTTDRFSNREYRQNPCISAARP